MSTLSTGTVSKGEKVSKISSIKAFIASRRPLLTLRLAGGLLWVVTIALIAFGAATGSVEAVPAGLVVLFASLAILFALETFRGLEAGEGFAVESHWGGLGGGLGGWRISRPLMFLAAALVSAGLTFAVAHQHLQAVVAEQSEVTEEPAAEGS